MEVKKCESTSRLSRIVTAGDTIYLSGTVAPPDCKDVTAQTQWILEKAEQMLSAYGADRSDILSATIHLRSMTDFGAMNEVWDTWFSEALPPARTCVGAELASPHALVEITFTAAKE